MFETFLAVVFLYLICKFVYRIVYSGISLQSAATTLRTQQRAAREMQSAKAVAPRAQAETAMPAADDADLGKEADRFIKDNCARRRRAD